MPPEHPTPAIMGNGSCRALPGLPVTADQAVFAFLFDGREKQQEWHRGSITSRLFFTGDVEVFLLYQKVKTALTWLPDIAEKIPL